MEGAARIWFTPRQRAELWERWKTGSTIALDCQSGDQAQWRLQRLPRGRGRSARLGASVAPEALSPGSPREATMAGRAEARTAVVAGADLRVAEAATPCRPRHADIARNDLSKSLY
jgi:hypothetical protein